MGGGNNTGMRAARRPLLRSCSTRTPGCAGDGLERLVAFADAHPAGRGRRAAARATPTGRCSARSAASRRSGGSRPSTSSCASSAPRTRRAQRVLRRRLRPRRDARRSSRSTGAALLVRREAADEVGLFDESFFMFSEETDWLAPLPAAGWKVLVHARRRGRPPRRRLARRRGSTSRTCAGSCASSPSTAARARRSGRGCCCSGRCGCGRSSSAASAARAIATAPAFSPPATCRRCSRDRRVPAARASRPASCCCPAASSRGALGQRGARAGARLGVRLRSSSPGRSSSSCTGRSGSRPSLLAAIGLVAAVRRRRPRRPPAAAARRTARPRRAARVGRLRGRGRARARALAVAGAVDRRRALPRGARPQARRPRPPPPPLRRRARGRRAPSRLRLPALARLPRARREAVRASTRASSCTARRRCSSPLACLRRLGGRGRGLRLGGRRRRGARRVARALLLRGGPRRLVRLARAAGDRGAAAARPGGDRALLRLRESAGGRRPGRARGRRSARWRSSTRPTRSSR